MLCRGGIECEEGWEINAKNPQRFLARRVSGVPLKPFPDLSPEYARAQHCHDNNTGRLRV